MEAREALAEAWASIDGKLDEFRRGKVDADYENEAGHYEGYLADAAAMIERLETRGFVLVPLPAPPLSADTLSRLYDMGRARGWRSARGE